MPVVLRSHNPVEFGCGLDPCDELLKLIDRNIKELFSEVDLIDPFTLKLLMQSGLQILRGLPPSEWTSEM